MVHNFALFALVKMSATKTRTLMTEEELIELEKQEFETGPLSVLLNAVKNNTQVSLQNFCD